MSDPVYQDSFFDVMLTQNSQANVRARNANAMARDAMEGEAAAKRAAAGLASDKEQLSRENAYLRMELDKLKDGNALAKEIENLKTRNKELETMVIKQKSVLRDWMISQTAFKNLFRRYGKLDDGTSIVSLPQEEKVQMVEQAKIPSYP